MEQTAERPNGSPPGAKIPRADLETETRKWSMFVHFSLYLGIVVPLLGLLVPILIWQMKKEELPGIDIHGKAVANWMLSSFIYIIGCVLLTFVGIGLLLLPILAILQLVYPLVGGIKANNGKPWSYPPSIPFLR